MGQSKKDYAQQAKERRRQIEQEEAAKRKRQNKLVLGTVAGALAILLIVVGIIFATRPKESSAPADDTTTSGAPKAEDIDMTPLAGDPLDYQPTETETDLVRMTVSYTTQGGEKQQGDIYIRLFPDVAPITVANFRSLVASGFYNGLTFHRIMPGFVIQGGDPDGDGTGGSGTNIKGEFSANGVENNLSHTRGVFSMARGSYSMDSASSQFFIVLDDSAIYSLDGSYASFGYVVSGMETVDAIAAVELITVSSQSKKPVYPVTIESAVFVTKNS